MQFWNKLFIITYMLKCSYIKRWIKWWAGKCLSTDTQQIILYLPRLQPSIWDTCDVSPTRNFCPGMEDKDRQREGGGGALRRREMRNIKHWVELWQHESLSEMVAHGRETEGGVGRWNGMGLHASLIWEWEKHKNKKVRGMKREVCKTGVFLVLERGRRRWRL